MDITVIHDDYSSIFKVITIQVKLIIKKAKNAIQHKSAILQTAE